MIYSDLLLYHACQESNRIEGEPLSGLSFENHYRAALLARTAAKQDQLLHPLVLHQLLFKDIPITVRLGEYRPPGMTVYLKQQDGNDHVFPNSQQVPTLMGAWWAEWSNAWFDGEPDFYSALVRFWFHAWYEAIHPQHDGNGRTGRLLWWSMAMIAGQELEIISYEKREAYFIRLQAWRADHCNEPDMNPFR